MNKPRKVGLTAALTGVGLLASTMLPAAFAGTGGSDHAGIIYGQDAAYCDAQAVNLIKVDSHTGVALEGATFTLSNPTANPVGVLECATAPTAAQIAADRIKWQEAFDTALDNTFTASAYGQAWLNASIATAEARKPGANSDTDPTQYSPSGAIYSPMDITHITDAASQRAAMQGWATEPSLANTTNSVTAYFDSAKERLDAIGAVYFSDYNPATGTGSTVTPALAGSDSQAMVKDAYDKAFATITNLMAAVHASGYTSAGFNATGLSLGAYNLAGQDWSAFVTAYNLVVTPGAYSFGIGPVSYDVMYNTLGSADVIAAETIANTAVGATAVGANLALTTGADGEVNYAVFGRTVTEGTFGTADNTMDRTCSHLSLTVTETKAPQGYQIDDPAPRVVVPAASEDSIVNEGWADSLIKTGTVDTPQPPTFESGL